MFTWLKKSLTLALLLCFSSFAFGVTFVSPQNRINIWEGPNAIPRSSYSIGSTTVMGEVLTLQSNALVTGILSNRNYTTNTGGLDFTRTPGAFLSSVAIPGYGNRLHQRLSDNYGSLGQCVAFARSMTSAGKSNTWWAGKTIGSYLTWNGVGYRLDSTSNMLNPLKPGTMIAYFRGQSQYPQNPSSAWDAGHVAIFLSWVYDQNNYIIGMKVIDENLVPTVSNASGLSGLIQKHMLPIVCPSGQNCTNTDGKYNLRYIATSYNVVDVR